MASEGKEDVSSTKRKSNDASLVAPPPSPQTAMPSSTSKRTTVSSPGKVLLAGGYLVLDPAHQGYVVSTSSRFYTSISSTSSAPPPPSSSSSSASSPSIITVRSPQFIDAEWKYLVDPETGKVTEEEVGKGGKNKFVRIAVEKTLKVAEELVGKDKVAEGIKGGWDVVILGDNDFYSQRKQVRSSSLASIRAVQRKGRKESRADLRTVPFFPIFLPFQLESLSLPLTFDSLAHLPPFAPTHTTLGDVHKTGLGSSAALITSLCAAILLHLSAVPTSAFSSSIPSEENEPMRLVHNVAQYCHCLAQGKVGSGFDVSSAVWGSQIYRKFGVDALEELMTAEDGVSSLPVFFYPLQTSAYLFPRRRSPPRPSFPLCNPQIRNGRTRSTLSVFPPTRD